LWHRCFVRQPPVGVVAIVIVTDVWDFSRGSMQAAAPEPAPPPPLLSHVRKRHVV
jgi:hypothetical protein